MQYFPGVQECISFGEMIDNSKMIKKWFKIILGAAVNYIASSIQLPQFENADSERLAQVQEFGAPYFFSIYSQRYALIGMDGQLDHVSWV